MAKKHDIAYANDLLQKLSEWQQEDPKKRSVLGLAMCDDEEQDPVYSASATLQGGRTRLSYGMADFIRRNSDLTAILLTAFLNNKQTPNRDNRYLS